MNGGNPAAASPRAYPAHFVTLTLAISHQGRGELPPAQSLWIPACAGMTWRGLNLAVAPDGCWADD